MKKESSFFFLVFTFVASFTQAQLWDSLKGFTNLPPRVMYADTVDNYMYAAGFFYTVDNKPMKGIARWNGAKWDSLGSGIDGLDTLNFSPQNTLAITRYNNKLILGGVFKSLGNIPAKCIGTWNGTNWDTLSVQPFPNNYTNAVYSMAVINNELYVGGVFDTLNNIPCSGMAKWDGTNWNCINLPIMISTTNIQVICEYKGEIYLGGNFKSPLYPNDTIQDIIKYDGTNFKSVGGGLKGAWTIVESMVVYNNELYVAGMFSAADGNVGNNIQKWDGVKWSDVGGGTGGINGQIHKLLVYKNKLYAMGALQMAGGVFADRIAVWDGNNWCSSGSIFDNRIVTGCVYKDSLYIGGGFWTIDGNSINHIAKWKGGDFNAACGNISSIEDMSNNSETIKLYPNPANNLITLEFENIYSKNNVIEITNTLGEIIKTINNNNNSKVEIDVSQFALGLYFVSVKNDKEKYVSKFIKN